MTGALLIALALVQTTPTTQHFPMPVTLWTTMTLPSGERLPVSSVRLDTWASEPQVRYFYANPTVCTTLATARKPDTAAYGWRVEVRPGRGRDEAQILWSRLHGKETLRVQALELPKSSASSVVVDRLAGDAPLAPRGGGCTATELSLEAKLGSMPAVNPSQVLEAELWFVHKTPDGKETSQRQAIRMPDGGGRGDFYFDDLNLTVGTGSWTLPIAVEVFGTISTGTMTSGGKINMILSLTRRYINKETALGSWPKTGSTDYPLIVQTGEVVSFLLPPLADDGGILLGHRFSLRLRIKPLGEGDN